MGSPWRIGIALIVFLIGILVGTLLSKAALFDVDPKLDFGNILQVLATLILALLISIWGREQYYRSDTAKEILTEYLRQLRTIQSQIRSDFRQLVAGDWDQRKYAIILAAFRDASNTMLEIETTAKAVFKRDPCDKLRAELFALKAMVTSVTPSRLRVLSQFGDVETAFSKFQICLAETQAAILQL